MHLAVIGLNYKTAPLDLREKLYIPNDRIPALLARLKELETISECFVLSTCNRTEVYSYSPDRLDETAIVGAIGRFCGLHPESFAPQLYTHSGHDTAEHLFRVTAGIDSMVLGEAQILGQVKEAYSLACKNESSGAVLNTLFQQAISVGKRARTETEIGRGSFSIGSVAANLARSIFDRLDGRAILVIGAGKMSELTVAHLIDSGVSRLLMTNRTYETALELASRFDGEPVHFGNITAALQIADIVIASTGADEPVITQEMVRSVMTMRSERPIFFIDIAVPRDIESDVAKIDNVFVYNVDDLQTEVNSDTKDRLSEVAKVESIIDQETTEFARWLSTMDSVPVIFALRDKLEEIRSIEVEKLHKKLPHLSQEDLNEVEMMTKSMVNRICHNPVTCIKEKAADGDGAATMDAVCEIFDLRTTSPGREP